MKNKISGKERAKRNKSEQEESEQTSGKGTSGKGQFPTRKTCKRIRLKKEI